MPDRSVPPRINEIESLTLPTPVYHRLDNGLPVYEICMGTQDVVKVEVVFRAGRPFEHKKLVARATVQTLKEGSKIRSGAEVADMIDYYGGSLSTPVSLDTSSVVLYSLNKHFDKLLPLLAELVTQPAFPQTELDAFVRNNRQRLQVDLSKNDVVAYRQITELIFGDEHPYGYNSQPDTYLHLERSDLVRHFERTYLANNCYLFVSGKTSEHTLHLLNQYFGHMLPTGTRPVPRIGPASAQPVQMHLPNPNSVQTAIRIGRRLFNRRHPDYEGLQVVNTILGGYFGSRLMANIREDKGYTYNIFSTIDAMKYDGYFYIGTEVGNEFLEATLKEIYSEMELMREELIDESELEMVRSYLLGNLLTTIDGPFNVAEIVSNYIISGTPLRTFEQMVQTIKTISPEEIRELARRYLRRSEMWEVIVGG